MEKIPDEPLQTYRDFPLPQQTLRIFSHRQVSADGRSRGLLSDQDS
jgi:hypothetical protein